jgi:hypothetical protein
MGPPTGIVLANLTPFSLNSPGSPFLRLVDNPRVSPVLDAMYSNAHIREGHEVRPEQLRPWLSHTSIYCSEWF